MQFGVMLGPADMEQLGARSRYRHMALQARAAGAQPLFFTLSGLNETASQVEGWTEQDGQWQAVTAAVPAVIYNRATYGNREESQTATRLLRTLVARRQSRLINPVNAFSKMAVSEALRFFAGTADLAPETRALTGPDDLTALLQRHPTLFLKADYGSHGSDVVRLRADNSRLGIRGRIGSRPVDEHFGTAAEVFAFFELLGPETAWVVQQGVDLPKVNGQIFDLRVIAQKDGSARWQLPLVLVRLARPGHVAANMSQGGEPFLPAAFLAAYGDQIPHLSELVESVSDAALRTVLALESRFGLMGEIGIDIGLDQQGSAWIFEANTKPLHPTVPGLAEECLLQHPFAYGVHLVRQAQAGRESGLSLPVGL